MIEQQNIKGKDVWIKVDPFHVQREHANIIPTEYFTATYFLKEPANNNSDGEVLKDEDGAPKLFESPVAALSSARKRLEGLL